MSNFIWHPLQLIMNPLFLKCESIQVWNNYLWCLPCYLIRDPSYKYFMSSLSKSCKMNFNVIWKIMISWSNHVAYNPTAQWSWGHHIAHVTTALLSWHVQNCDLIGSLERYLDQYQHSRCQRCLSRLVPRSAETPLVKGTVIFTWKIFGSWRHCLNTRRFQ